MNVINVGVLTTDVADKTPIVIVVAREVNAVGKKKILVLVNKGFPDQMLKIESNYDGYGRITLTEKQENILPDSMKWEDFGLSVKKESVFDLSSNQMKEIILLELNEYTTRKRDVTKIYCKTCYFN